MHKHPGQMAYVTIPRDDLFDARPLKTDIQLTSTKVKVPMLIRITLSEPEL